MSSEMLEKLQGAIEARDKSIKYLEKDLRTQKKTVRPV